MNKIKISALCIALVLGIVAGYAQKTTWNLEGTVLEPYYNKPVEGAVVSISGLKESVKTDKDGKFSAKLSSSEGELTVWFPGYYTNVQPIAGRKNVTVMLIPEEKSGYSDNMLLPFKGSTNIREKQTNLFSVQKKDISLNKSEIEQVLAKIPGLQVIGKSGMPGEGSYFNIRGANTFTANSSPLIVVNGIPYMPDMNESGVIGGFSKSILNSLNPRDIQNITVLKGADATLYGSLGSNGVIMIETDKAVDLDTKVEFSSQFGVDMNQSKLPVLGVSDYKNYIGSVALTKYSDMAEALNAFPYLVDDQNYYYKYLYNSNTNWQNLIYSPGFTTDDVLKIKGGDEIAKYDISIGYKNKGGQMTGTNYSKYYVRANADVNLSRKISFNSSIMMSYMDYSLEEQGMLEATNPILAAMKKGPLFSPYKKDADNNLLPDYASIRDDAGNLIVNNMVSNPLALVNKVNASDQDYDVQINTGLNYKMNDNISINGIMGLYYFFTRQNMFVPGVTETSIMPLNNQLANNTVRSAQGITYNSYFNLNANYNKTFNDLHLVKASIGAQIAMNKNEYDAGSGFNTTNDFYKTLGYVSSSSRKYYGYVNAWNWMSYNANAQYIYNHQLALGANMSVDASSSTGTDAQLFQVYPSVNATWMTKNSILKNFNSINKLNIRAEYFTTGNSRFSSSLSKYYYTNKVFYELSGLTRSGIPNTKIVPELSQTFNLGTDISVFNNRLDLTVDVYSTKNSNLIMPVSALASYGTDYVYANAASAENKGVELGAQFTAIQTKNLKWYLGATVSSNKSSVLSLAGQKNMIMSMSDGSAVVSEIGSPLYSFYGLNVDKSNPVFATAEQATTANLKTPAGLTYEAGDVHFVDQNNDGIIDDRDRVNLGNADPAFFGTFNTSIQYKKFELSANFGYSIGNKMYNAVRRSMESMSDFSNQLVSANRRWMSEGQVTEMPRASYGDPLGNSQFSDRWIEDASYFKLKELTLSYNFKFMNGTTVYISGENLFTITNYLGLDPETMYSYDSSLRGFDYGKVSQARSIKVGFNVKL
ncbi:MAG: SusC/RagA family TonB-linked outer membrane protein [Paludibacter sp.]|nr:SusC/RagA family TonB-linked outer membrane protein [Paludibacter sp.]